MKRNILFLALIVIAFACTDDPINQDPAAPTFVSANVDEIETNKIIATFSEELHTTADGFTISINEAPQVISKTDGSGTRTITFTIDNAVSFNDLVTIEYDASIGNASNDDDVHLSSFTPKTVTNNASETEFSVLIPNIPPEANEYIIWLIIKTTESATAWKWDYKTAAVNMRLSVFVEADLFDVVIYAPEDEDWLPTRGFGAGYYATLLHQDDKYQDLKVITWLKDSTLSGTNMGMIGEEDAEIGNDVISGAITLRTDGMDYVEGEISATNDILWYVFTADVTKTYDISIRDNYTNSDDFSGIVKAVLCNSYLFEYEDLSPVLSAYPLEITGVNQDEDEIYIKVEESDLGGRNGTFQIIVIEQ